MAACSLPCDLGGRYHLQRGPAAPASPPCAGVAASKSARQVVMDGSVFRNAPRWAAVLSSMVVASMLGQASWFGGLIACSCGALALAGLMGRVTHKLLTTPVCAWLLTTGALGLVVAASAIGEAREAEHQRELADARQAEELRSKQAAAVELLASAPSLVQRAREHVRLARVHFGAEEYSAATNEAVEAQSVIAPVEHLANKIDGFIAVRNDARAMVDAARPFVTAGKAYDDAQTHLGTEMPDILTYDAQLEADLDALREIAGAPRERLAKDIDSAIRAVEKKRASMRRAVKKAEHQRAERLALSMACGDQPPLIGGWDGELLGSESFLGRTAHDPRSIDVEHCTTPVLSARSCWITECDVRGKNAFGARVYDRMAFSVGRNGILGAESVR